MDIKINTRDLGLVVGGLAVGVALGFGLVKKAKKELRKEIIDNQTKTIKDLSDEKDTDIVCYANEVKFEPHLGMGAGCPENQPCD